jgi:Xaa-Pro aminopeptidase
MRFISKRPPARERLRVFFSSALVALAVLSSIKGAGATSITENDRLANQPKSEYQLRRTNLLAQIKDGIVVMIGGREEDLGEVGRFRQYNDFIYLTGVETPAASLILVPAGLIEGKPAQETVFIPPRNPMHERWTGVQIGPGAEGELAFGFKEVAGSDKFMDRLQGILNAPPFKGDQASATQAAKLYTIVPKGPTAPITRENQLIETVKRIAPHAQIADVSPLIHEMRKIKGPSEIALLQRAIDITGEAQREAAVAIKSGAYEYEAQAALEAAFTRNGAERPSFPSIVGSGINSTILHYNINRKKIESGDVVVVDIGAEYGYYAADITRTYPATGKFTQRQGQIYQLVLDAQRAAEKAFKPGKSTFADLQRAAAAVMQSSPLRDAQGNTLERYFIHGLSHYLGMDVHDVGSLFKPIPVNAVFTIEPGIYIPEEKLGVRIEDDYLVTQTGLVKMSDNIPSALSEIERLMSTRSSAMTAK